MKRRDFLKIFGVATAGLATFGLPEIAKAKEALSFVPVAKYDIVEIVIDSHNTLRMPIKKALNHPAFFKNQHKIIHGRIVL